MGRHLDLLGLPQAEHNEVLRIERALPQDAVQRARASNAALNCFIKDMISAPRNRELYQQWQRDMRQLPPEQQVPFSSRLQGADAVEAQRLTREYENNRSALVGPALREAGGNQRLADIAVDDAIDVSGRCEISQRRAPLIRHTTLSNRM